MIQLTVCRYIPQVSGDVKRRIGKRRAGVEKDCE